MKCVDKDSFLRIFYKTDALATGQNVVFNVWDHYGSPFLLNTSATDEVGSEGVYYLDATSPPIDVYLLAIASNEGYEPEAQVIKVGDPDKKVFYVQGNFEADKSLYYEIYDEDANVLSNGNLTSVVHGFYWADVEGLPEPWFFQVFPWVRRNMACETVS